MAEAQTVQELAGDRATIAVMGAGEAQARPDLAISTFTVLRSAQTARAALDDANQATAAVIAALEELGIQARDLQTSGFSITPQYRYENPADGTQRPPELVGYDVRNTLTARVREIGRLGEILDRVVTLGVNEGGDIAFSVEDADGLRNAARRDAVENARSSARILAEAAGVELGRVVEIQDSPDSPMPMPIDGAMRMMASEASKSVPIATGETTIRASVRMVFEIER